FGWGISDAYCLSVRQPFTTDTQLMSTTAVQPVSPTKNSVSTVRMAITAKLNSIVLTLRMGYAQYLRVPSLFYPFVRIPRTLQFAHVENLSHVIGAMRADMRDQRRALGKVRVTGVLDRGFPVGQFLVQLLHQIVPLCGIEFVEGLVVVAIEFFRLLALELLQRARIPIPDVIRKLAHQVSVLARRFPLRLFRCHAVDRDRHGHEPVLSIVRAAELLQQHSAQI